MQALLGDEKGFLLKQRLAIFNSKRNDPNNTEAVSNLSPYLHFGQLSAQRTAMEASKLRSKYKVRGSAPGSVLPFEYQTAWRTHLTHPEILHAQAAPHWRGAGEQWGVWGLSWQDGVDSFLEECVVRRELSDNYCLYTPKYDTLDACYDWARDTLNKHAGDQREYVYTRWGPGPCVLPSDAASSAGSASTALGTAPSQAWT